MYVVLILYALYVNVVCEPCTTPFNETGECVPVRSCPSLLWSFTNPKWGIDEYLQIFVCSNDELGLIVCCRIAKDYLVFEDEENNYESIDIENVELVNFKNCGISNNLEIQNGKIRLVDFPWLIKILTVNDSDEVENRTENVGCTGVLINNWYALYSAQCHYSVLGNFNTSVRINTYTGAEENCIKSSYSPQCSTFEDFQIEYSTVHPFYDAQTKINDIAILRLSRRFQYSDFIQPICLPIHSEHVKVGETLQTAGWRRTFTLDDFSVKTSQSSTLISDKDCQNGLLKNGINATLSIYEMCTYTEENIQQKDVGLPLMSLQNSRWYLEGFESQGENTKTYSRVQNYLYWIQQLLGGERCLTPYNQTGECVHLNNCPKLMHAFANPSPKDEDILWEYVCEYDGEDSYDLEYILKVCCVLEDDFIIPPETNDTDLNFYISNFRYCGLQHRDDYISSDNRISVDEFPWLATIVNATLPEQRDRLCGGTLITERYVITSGQCIYWFNDEDVVLVRLGDYNLNKSSNCIELAGSGLVDCTDVQEYEIEEIIYHPFYNAFYLLNDISLLRLNKTVTYSDYVRPICIPRSEDDLANYGAILYTTGFGNTREGEQTDVKKKIPTTLISNEVCSQRLKFLHSLTPVTPYQICSQDFKNSSDVTCWGDDGGPVMYSKKLRWFIEGISSSYSCGGEDPQTHLSVFKYSKWLKLNMKD